MFVVVILKAGMTWSLLCVITCGKNGVARASGGEYTYCRICKVNSMVFFFPLLRYDICTYKNKPCGTLGECTSIENLHFHGTTVCDFTLCSFFLLTPCVLCCPCVSSYKPCSVSFRRTPYTSCET